MNLKDFLEDCKREQIIDQSTVDLMYAHFLTKTEKTSRQESVPKAPSTTNNNVLIITVSIIGVLLIGFGIIYLFAHNWDHLSRPTKTFLSILPVLIGVGVNIFTILKRPNNVIWQESSAIYSFLAVGSMLALILQVYQLPGIENYFYTYWCLLCLPLVYLMHSHAAVVFSLLLMFFNLYSNPIDQSELYRIPWFGSLMLFLALTPYYKRLFTQREPDYLYVIHQILVPLFVCLSALIYLKGSTAASWLILFLVLGNFHLFGTSHFLKKKDNNPNILSIISYVGLSLCLTYLLFNKEWNFISLFDGEIFDYRLMFVPILLALGLVQLFVYFKQEKPAASNLHKWIFIAPFPFIIPNYFGIDTYFIFQLSLVGIGFILLYFAQIRKDSWQIYPVLGLLSMLSLSLSFTAGNAYSFFLIALIPSLYYLIPVVLIEEKEKNSLNAEHILIICAQILILLTASFGGFWQAVKSTKDTLSLEQQVLVGLVSLLTFILAFKHRLALKNHVSGYMSLISLTIPMLILIAVLVPFGLQHLFSVILLLIGILVLILSAKKSNLTLANLALGLIGVVMLCRFLDQNNISLTLKGILFILVGTCFFVANYLILKSRKHENKH